MSEYPFTCRDEHIEIGFRVEPPNGDERCPLCLLRDQVLLEIAQPRASFDQSFYLTMASLALESYPFEPVASPPTDQRVGFGDVGVE